MNSFLISEHLINSTSTNHQLLGIIMASGIPLAHLKNQNIKTPYNFKSNILPYTLSSGLQIQTYSLICYNRISRCIENLDKNRLLSVMHVKLIMWQTIYLVLELLLNN
ncbi:hypothetical protein PT136_04805 (plasmid) [Borreliella garinii]|uniref:hypothetical protein n=1 Tax=Borreliella garinii TaxID=29519 RepID=UPI0029315A45|nr:hypothetical protein [Borreliella garinii]WNZ72155.1 hypothetical protein PT136_04805 [Borreliella garinii]